MPDFIGRQVELNALNTLLELRQASLVVMNGRRRIGKSRLIAEFAKPYPFYKFTGLAPHPDMTAQDQRNEFMRQFNEYFGIPIAGITDWGVLLTLLAKQTQSGRVVILFDEISWMADGDVTFLPKLKTLWDDLFSKNSALILFLCGSVSTWIEENLIASTAFLGRPTMHIQLKELILSECAQFWDDGMPACTAYEKLKTLSVTGGVPRYLELMNPKQTAEDNIRRLFFSKESMLLNEYDKIFKDIYGKKTGLYKEIIDTLLDGPKTQDEMTKLLLKSRSGDLGQYLTDLTLGGFISRDYNWHLKTGKISNLSKYRLSDNYLRFALKYIEPNRQLIEKGRFEERSLKTLPGWDTLMGLQFENLVLSNTRSIIKALGVLEQDIIFDNPYFQRATQRQRGCQVDYMIQTRHDTVFVCEAKLRKNEIGLDIIDEMKDKLGRLQVPKHISKRAVLIHVNGVKDTVEESLFFTKIIDFGDFLLNQRDGIT